jgi:hypothetical protein
MIYAYKASLVLRALMLALFLLWILNRFLKTLSFPAITYEKIVIAVFTDAYQHGKGH